MNIKENAQNVDTWIRGLFILVFAVIFYVLYMIIGLLVLFQFFNKVITGGLNQYLLEFGSGMTRYVEQILLYITFLSEQRPFPFSPWPGSDYEASAPDGAGPGDA
jgi:hypothetical protein